MLDLRAVIVGTHNPLIFLSTKLVHCHSQPPLPLIQSELEFCWGSSFIHLCRVEVYDFTGIYLTDSCQFLNKTLPQFSSMFTLTFLHHFNGIAFPCISFLFLDPCFCLVSGSLECKGLPLTFLIVYAACWWWILSAFVCMKMH